MSLPLDLPPVPIMPKSESRSQGFILIAVLWVAMLLSVFALNYATTSRLGAQRAMVVDRLTTDVWLRRSALALAEQELRTYYANQERLEQEAELEEERDPDQRAGLWYPRHEARTVDIQGQSVQVRVMGSDSRFDVNALPQGMLETILLACGLRQGAELTGVVNSILDWIDDDDLRRMEGAETPYYRTLEHPYPAKNAPLESIEELLLVKGIDADLFWGRDQQPGLIDFLDVFGQTEKLDINSVSLAALALVPGLREQTREAVLQARSAGRIEQMSDLAPLVDARDYEQLVLYFDVHSPTKVLIEARVMDPETNRPGRALRRRVLLDGNS